MVGAALDVVLVVLAAEQVGGAAASLDMAVDYAKIRHQFSRPIGSFQAIKHKLADLLLQVEMGRSSVDRALLAEHDPQRLAEAGAVAKVWCSDAFVQAAAENVHINGGTGFTWEHDAHLFFRRSRADEVLFGDASVHRERLGRAARLVTVIGAGLVSREGGSGAAGQFRVRDAFVDARLAGQAEHAFADDVALDLVRAAREPVAGRAEDVLRPRERVRLAGIGRDPRSEQRGRDISDAGQVLRRHDLADRRRRPGCGAPAAAARATRSVVAVRSCVRT